MTVLAPSTKEQIVLTAERLFAIHGIDGVSLRQIGAAAGNGNNSAVQYHFGSKDGLVQAIFEHRLPHLTERRRLLVAERRPADLRGWVECYVLPIMEQAEQEGTHYLSFVSMLQQHGTRETFDHLPEVLQAPTREFYDRARALLPEIPEPLCSHRISQAMTFCVHMSSERERALAHGFDVLPFAIHVTDLLDGLVGFLRAPVSPTARAALADSALAGSRRLVFP